MEKIDTGMLVLKLSKLLLSRRHARKGKSRLGLSHRKKGSSRTSPCPVCVNSYCITSHKVVIV